MQDHVRLLARLTLLSLIPTLQLFAQSPVSYPDTAPPRGVAPVGSYDFDQLETINKATGNLTYTIPLTSMPLGRGGMTIPINLTYNSSQFDYTYSYTYGTTTPNPPLLYQQLTPDPFGGWSIDPGYHLYFEQKPVPFGSYACSTASGAVRTSLIAPNGARHVLYFSGFPGGFTGSGDGYFPWTLTGTSACPQQIASITGPFHLFTVDGSYISMDVSASGTQTVNMPNGTTVTLGSPEIITDRNGNSIQIAYTATDSGTTITVTDDFSRSIVIQQSATGGYNVTQTGISGAILTWTFAPTNAQTTAVQFPYVCQNQATFVDNGGTDVNCVAMIESGGADTLQVPSNDPNNPLVYKFQYGAQSNLLQTVTLPSGASTTYQYSCMNYPVCFQNTLNLLNQVVGKTRTWIDQADGGIHNETWSYSWGAPISGPLQALVEPFTKTSPDNGVETSYVTNVGGYFPGVTLRVVEPNGDSDDNFYQLNRPYGVSYGSPNPYIAATVHSVAQGGNPSISAVTLYQYDKNGNQLSETSYDWTSYSSTNRASDGVYTSMPVANGTQLKLTKNNYKVTTAAQAGSGSEAISDDNNGYWNPGAPKFLHLLANSSITGSGTGSLIAYSYDKNANPQSMSQWDSTKAPTMPSSSALTSANASVTSWAWWPNGNLMSETDPKGNVTSYIFDPNNLYLAQKVQAAGTSVQRTFNYLWDDNLGVLTSKTDVDNSITTTYGYDAMGRQTSMTEGSGARSTQTVYNDTARTVTVHRDQNLYGDGFLTNVTTYDELYRPALSQQMEAAGDTIGIQVQTRYMYNGNANASYKLVSNPFRPSSEANDPTMGWTLLTYDQNGRGTSSQTFSGSTLPAPWGGNTVSTGTVATRYSTPTAQSTRVVDQLMNQRDSSMDGLGRLVSVTEYPGSGTYATGYSYDVLGDLTGVMQSSQTRTFAYDSMKRLIASTNPESYSVGQLPALGCSNGGVYATCYYYDANGNLATKVDNRGSGVQFVYDALNRITGKSYFNLSHSVNYQAVGYTYDNSSVPNSKGRLTSVYTLPGNYRLVGDTSATNYLGYNTLGQIVSSSQTTGGATYVFGYSYNLADALTSETYPSGRVVRTCYDGANRVAQVGGSSCTSTNGAFASNILYTPQNAPMQYVFGNNLWRNLSYNSRLQMTGFADSLNGNAGTVLMSGSLTWYANNAPAQNNGNLQIAAYQQSGPAYSTPLSFSQTFNYDGVNRLLTASDSGGWSRSFAYDAYGNITPSGNPAPPTVSFNSNNQIVGATYDQAGNQQSVNGNLLSYDPENRILCETDGISKAVETYVYDGDGKRVAKYGSNALSKTIFVYDASGQLAAEYAASNSSPCELCYLSVDHLGTPRLITDQSGKVVARHDYLPFGEEVAPNTFGRDSSWGPLDDNINQKFTSKERDSESGLDYFGARYYGSALGRFSSPDPEQASASLFNPQLWNGYSYSINNPLAYKDPDGRNPLLVTAAVGAGVGALVGGGFEFYSQWSQNGYSTDSLNWGKVGTAALGGGVTGGVAGLTLGLGTAAGITLGVGETVAVNAGANIIGGEAQRQANDALGLQAAPSGADEAAAIAIDGITGGVGGLVGGRIADEIYPLPNVKKEIELLKFANRRSTRAAQRLAFDRAVDRRAAQNAATSGVQGGSRTSVGTWWSQLFWNFFSHPQQEPKACVSVSDSASGSHFGGCN